MNSPALFRGAAALVLLASLAGCQSGPDQSSAEPALVEGVSSVGMRLNPMIWGTIAHFDIVSVDGQTAHSKVRDLIPPGHHTIVIHTVAGFSGRTNNATVTLDLRPGGTYMLRPTSIGGLVYALAIDNDNARVVFRPEVTVVATSPTALPEAPPAAPAPAPAAPPPPAPPPATAPAGSAPIELAVWPGAAPGSENATAPETSEERGKNGVVDRALRQVSKPTLTLYLPDKSIATGAALLIVPGGAFEHVTIDREGNDIARWLVTQGVAGIVLKYRLPKTPGQSYTVDTAMADAMQALRDVRDRASEWGIDPARLGMIGFSAGGEMTARAAVWPDAALRPAYVGLIYPLVPKDLAPIPSDAPRAFLVQADDDMLGTENALRFYQWEREKKIPAELLLFPTGGHGFSLGRPGTPTTAWPKLFRDWLASIGAAPAPR